MGSCFPSKEADHTPENLDLNFDNPEVSDEEERKIHELVAEALSDTQTHLEVLHEYSGCEEPIRKALNDPGPKTEAAAWKAVSKAVEKLYGFYKISTELEKVWPQTLDAICSDDDSAIANNLALIKQFAEIFDFVFHFDEAKMVNPAIQNDFSYYRRVLSRMKNADKDKKEKILVDEELANKMSFFFAYPTPMMKVLIDATTEFDKNAKDRLISGLALICDLCLKALEKEDSTISEKTSMLYLCTMTGCIILVDHLHDDGAFHKDSPMRIKGSIGKIRDHELGTDFLLNSLRFTTLHLNDEKTQPAITKLLS